MKLPLSFRALATSVATVCALLLAGSANAVTITLDQSSGTSYDSVGDGWFFTTPPNQPPDGVGDQGGQALAVGKINGTLELRAMAEFPLASLAGLTAADIQSAVLTFNVDDVIGTFGPGANFDGTASDPIAVYGYPADGTVTVADFAPAGLVPQETVAIGNITDASLAISGPVQFTVDVTQLVKDRLTGGSAAVGILFGTTDSPTATSIDDQSPPGVAGGVMPFLTIETVPTDPPVFSKAEVKCQSAINKQALNFSKKVQGEIGKCLDTVLGAVSKGGSAASVAAKCTKALTESDPKSQLAKARSSATTAIGKSCEGIAPGDINSPCDGAAPNIGATIACVLDTHRENAEHNVAASYSDACTILRSVDLDASFPDVCAP